MSRIYALDQGIFDIVEPRAWAYEYRRGKNHFYLAKWANAFAWTFAAFALSFDAGDLVNAAIIWLMCAVSAQSRHSLISLGERTSAPFEHIGFPRSNRHSPALARSRVLLFLVLSPLMLCLVMFGTRASVIACLAASGFAIFQALSIYLEDCDSMPPKWEPRQKERAEAAQLDPQAT